jgi:hypothetical protein
MSIAPITLCVASQRVFVVVVVVAAAAAVYFAIDSVRKLLDTLSYERQSNVNIECNVM